MRFVHKNLLLILLTLSVGYLLANNFFQRAIQQNAQQGNIAYTDKGMDITEVVVAQLNRDYAGSKKDSK